MEDVAPGPSGQTTTGDRHPVAANRWHRPTAAQYAARCCMRLYCTAQRAVVPLQLEQLVGMYVCGITPYDSTHLGHAATFVAYDLIVRRLESLGHSVTLVRNFTDVDDSILPKAAELGEHYQALAAREIERFRSDMNALAVRPPDREPRATQSIVEIVELIGRLKAQGFTYEVEGTTYFDIAHFPAFGQLSGLDHDAMVKLAAERGGSPDNPNLKNQLDFVLWQPSAAGEPRWPSPFGVGRPGWHIECSAMAANALGVTVDVHGGGGDLVFPHHECELAQSEAVGAAPFARYWVHAGLVAYEGEKMSKSLGNLVFVSDLRQEHSGAAIRLALLRHHYRSDWEWFNEMMAEADRDLALLTKATQAAPAGGGLPDGEQTSTGLVGEVGAALDDDLNTPAAIELLLGAANSDHRGTAEGAAAELVAAAGLCGINLT